MVTYTVRRDGNNSGDRISIRQTDIYISNGTVSGTHGTLVEAGEGRYEFNDNNSTNGTFIREDDQWVRVMSAELQEHDEIRFGTFATRVSDLLGSNSSRREPAPRGMKTKLERHPETGEIVEKKWR